MALEQRKRIDELSSIAPEDDTLLVGQRPGEAAGSFPASDITGPILGYIDTVVANLLRDLSGELVSSGTANAFEVVSVREPLVLTDGFAITFRADRSNSGASTLKVSAATAAKPLQKEGAADLISGDIAQHAIYAAIYVESADAFRIRSVPLAAYAKLASPAFTGVPSVPTASIATNTQQAASTAFVQAVVAALVASSPAALDTLNELAAALGNDANFATTVTNNLALKAPLASPVFTGSPTTPAPPALDSSTKIPNTAWTNAAISAASVMSSVRHGECRLIKSGVNLALQPFNGNRIIVNGVVCTIPGAGVTLAPTGLTPSTNYYIYARDTDADAVIDALEASTTAPATHTDGIEIKNGDASRTLIGAARIVAGPVWGADAVSQRYIRSWFNEPGVAFMGSDTSGTTSTPTWNVAQSGFDVALLLWPGEDVIASASGHGYAGATLEGYMGVGFNSTPPSGYPRFRGVNFQGLHATGMYTASTLEASTVRLFQTVDNGGSTNFTGRIVGQTRRRNA